MVWSVSSIWSVLSIRSIPSKRSVLFFQSLTRIDQTDPIDQIDHFETAPPFHLQIQIERTTEISVPRYAHALCALTKAQHIFSQHSRLDQLFLTGCGVLQIRNQDSIKLPATHLLRCRDRTRQK